MNCFAFENQILDLKKVASLTAEMNSHVLECPRCALRLTNAQAMNSAMKTVALADKNSAPSPQLESALLSAFRLQHEKKVVPKIGWMDSLYAAFSQLKWGLATATVFILLGLAAAKMLSAEKKDIVVKSPELKPTLEVVSSTPVPEKLYVPEPAPSPTLVKRSPMNKIRPFQVAVQNPRFVAPKSNSSTSVEVGDFEILEPEKPLLAKDFIPFDYAATMPPADSLQVMRVPLSREKLASMGLTIPRSNRQSPVVNAHLLVGSDGIPRAINVGNFR
jgi:hypothetical protein